MRETPAIAHLGYVLGAALRYQLPRQTYGSAVIADAIIAAWPTLHAGDRESILREIRAADSPDWREWQRVLEHATAPATPEGGA